MNYFVFKEEVEWWELKYLWIAWKRIKTCPTRVKLADKSCDQKPVKRIRWWHCEGVTFEGGTSAKFDKGW